MNAVEFLDRRFRRPEWISLAIALASGAGLVIAAVLAPVYQSQSVSATGAITNSDPEGWIALLVAGTPLTAAVVAGYGLWHRAGRAGAGVLAWTVTGLLACFNVLAMATIGVLVIPVTAALLVACAGHGIHNGRAL